MSLIEKNWKLILGICIVLILGGAGVVIQSTLSISKEKNAQENFFLIEKKFSDYKTKKDDVEKETPEKTSTKANTKSKTLVIDKSKTEKETPENLANQLESIKKEFESFITNNPNSKATQMAALYFAEISRLQNNTDAALNILLKVQNNDSGLVNTLVQQQIGQLLANSEKYQEAIDIWQKIINRTEAKFLHNELKIQQALCYQKLNNMNKAEELLTNIANQKSDNQTDTPSVKEAARYLRLLQFKKVSGT